MKPDMADILFWVFFATITLFILFRVVKFRGFKAALFGASIQRTVGQVNGPGNSFSPSTTLKIHILSGGQPDRTVGIELVAKSCTGYQIIPVTLSLLEAEKLIDLLEQATSGKPLTT